ncbi:MAG TPA: patatin-like phospholipase family protein [Pyrinomonadaceae bacterium]|nr:patatin-like phospholipase family protein [Pyrinomonadaceae bacterium]
MKVGLALSGGGARGFAHVGVLKALIDNGIRLDLVAGTSAGAIVGAALAAGMSIDEIYAMSRRIGWLNFLRPSLSPRGLASNVPLGNFLRHELPVDRIEDLKMPYAAVVYDLTAGHEVVYKDSGDLIFAIRSSCAVPGVFEPVIDTNGHLMVDGGVTTVLPTRVARDLGADVVIAVDVISSGEQFRTVPWNAMAMSIRSAMVLLRQTAKVQQQLADVVVIPQIAHIRPDQINKREELLKLGEEAGQAAIEDIKKLISV